MGGKAERLGRVRAVVCDTGPILHLREGGALAHKASGFILAHNHPSGDATPSAHDRELTQAVKVSAAAVGVRFVDHPIIGDTTPFSFKANGLL